MEANQMYLDLNEIKSGEVEKTKISKVTRAKTKDIMPKEMIEKSKYPVALDQEMIKIETENGAVEYMNIPVDKKISLRTRLALFKKKYGTYPAAGQEVYTQIDEKGFPRILYK